ncbi:uncharacterized protein LOC115631454 [Scaptodrosophila lebanonensis]|uniref:Uncharacterized protein LOC115631454 n=1 Tax=Drosophila lebanonensis TaxID=7225 RepID=A0A6J2U7V5_DROLE|nr:uncharacterized protein LOC115631454 [Scaptodrosophila lebanonensis]
MVRKDKITLLLTAQEYTRILELKYMIGAILKELPSNMQLYNTERDLLEDANLLRDYDITSKTALPHNPAQFIVVVKNAEGFFGSFDIMPYSTPEPLPPEPDSSGDESLPNEMSLM